MKREASEVNAEFRQAALLGYPSSIKFNPPPRFQETRSDYRYDENCGYPCVNVHVDFNDNAAVTPDDTKKLELQVVAFYCRHPTQPKDAIYHIGTNRSTFECHRNGTPRA
ncbi:MAG: hypothetical protein LBI92_04485, partial [Azoarcus sp.]|nr:hypothetical protein [Azoarcus sp.]